MDIECAPGYDGVPRQIHFTSFDSGAVVTRLEGSGTTVDSVTGDEFPDYLTLIWDKLSEEDHGAAAIAMQTLVAFHEAVEFTKVDGELLADAHPWFECPYDDFESESYDWLGEKLLTLAKEYIQRYPFEHEAKKEFHDELEAM